MEETPTGLEHRDAWELTRINNIKEAITINLELGLSVPVEWLEEYTQLLNQNKYTKK